MLRFLLAGIATLTLAPFAHACSCICTYEHTISEYLDDHSVFWGTPKQSVLSSERLVSTSVDVLEGYSRLNSGETVLVLSSPDDGASCGLQLKVGVLQLIVAHKWDEKLTVSNCPCTPPLSYLIGYLKGGDDTFLPNLQNCRDDSSGNYKQTGECRVLRDAPNDHRIMFEEERRVRALTLAR